MHTMQSAFDAALNGVRGQQYRMAVANSGCVYFVAPGTESVKSKAGDRCGVGHMLKPETAEAAGCGGILSIMGGGYDKSWDTSPFKEELKGLDLEFLQSCQHAHDNMETAEQFESGMMCVAMRFDLTYTPPVVGPADC